MCFYPFFIALRSLFLLGNNRDSGTVLILIFLIYISADGGLDVFFNLLGQFAERGGITGDSHEQRLLNKEKSCSLAI